MLTPELNDLAARAKKLYDEKLRSLLEGAHEHEFVAIEPTSGDYFLGPTLSEALGAARDAYPDRLSHVMRVGHEAAIHFGVNLR